MTLLSRLASSQSDQRRASAARRSKPNPIAHVDIATAQRASPKMLGLGQSRSADLFADHGATRSRLVDCHDRGRGATP
jgi:hypothetical protein